MCQNCLVKTIHSIQSHFGWDKSFKSVATVAPGAMLEFKCLDSSNGYFTPRSTVNDVATMSFDQINPVTGPIFVEGAEPGDILKITLDSFKPSGFGWTANIPGFGLLADQFQTPALTLWHYDKDTLAPAAFSDFAKVPLKPFAGTIGLAPAEAGLHSVVPPRRVGGNLDIRDLSAGTTLYLPVEVAGALLSIGDTHAAQGDGEVCGTAIESQMDVVVKLDLIKSTPLASPRFSTPGPVTTHLDSAGYEAFTGVGSDLMQAARQAVSNTIDWLCREHHMPAEQAYMLCSVCGDLRISEVVDLPNWVVSFYFPKIVFA
ncbi:acetamidase/formamidase family protein [Pseudomonas sp. CBSPBW29]|uniref:acetamidase/formamidase family protein n=1 Tax=Pseudomonas sp. CBS TaxID=2971912 RepID=UPI0021ABC511|nr:acetamidase/formamidase family protein [Pseudomonas sp. CBS]WEL43518.1 acetamidase/formamidase family protein [Pseudomonas sp. CBSPBW29]WEL64585.1 acetamidase/formamidase family protein [Pseudomonas sp. CBSPGW29]WEL68054.1 acetamidase/formamidase family protein [Pseudomonas sp. CBSPCGW29]WEL75075.1 acetamidase/formamidase family protein [Pseudomonas sp. CBSPAW29]WEL80678.1 acetamidase/formamidase family protein [Pseudomonas sp. CBSPCAW29]WEL89195.1 acetamidase/formamidase family protein [P